MSLKNVYKYSKQKKLENFIIYTQAYKEYTIEGSAYTCIPVVEVDTAWDDTVTMTSVTTPDGITTREVYTPFYGDIDPRQISLQDDYMLLPLVVSTTSTYIAPGGARAVFCTPSDCVMMVNATVAQLIQNYFNNSIPANDFDIEINDYLGAATAWDTAPPYWPIPTSYLYTDDVVQAIYGSELYSADIFPLIYEIATEEAGEEPYIFDMVNQVMTYQSGSYFYTPFTEKYVTIEYWGFTIGIEYTFSYTATSTHFDFDEYIILPDNQIIYPTGLGSSGIRTFTWIHPEPVSLPVGFPGLFSDDKTNRILFKVPANTTIVSSNPSTSAELLLSGITITADDSNNIVHYSTGSIKCSQYKWLHDNNFPSQSTPIIASHFYEYSHELGIRGMEYTQYNFTPTQYVINAGGHWADGNSYQSWTNYHTFNGLDATLYSSSTYGQNSVGNTELKSKHTTAIQWIIDRQVAIDANKLVKEFHDKQMRRVVYASKKLGLGTTLTGNVSKVGISDTAVVQREFEDIGFSTGLRLQTDLSALAEKYGDRYSTVAIYNAKIFGLNAAEAERARIETELVAASQAYQQIERNAIEYYDTIQGAVYKESADTAFYAELQKLAAITEAYYYEYKDFMVNEYEDMAVGHTEKLLDSASSQTVDKLSSGILLLEDAPNVLAEYIAKEEANALSLAKKYGDPYLAREDKQNVVGVQGATTEGNFVAFRESYYNRYGEQYATAIKTNISDHENFHLSQALLQPFSRFSYSMNTEGRYYFSDDTSTEWAEDTANIVAAIKGYMDWGEDVGFSRDVLRNIAVDFLFDASKNSLDVLYRNTGSNEEGRMRTSVHTLQGDMDNLMDFATEWIELDRITGEDSLYNRMAEQASTVETINGINPTSMLSFKGTHSINNNSVETSYSNEARSLYNSLNRYKSRQSKRGQ